MSCTHLLPDTLHIIAYLPERGEVHGIAVTLSARTVAEAEVLDVSLTDVERALFKSRGEVMMLAPDDQAAAIRAAVDVLKDMEAGSSIQDAAVGAMCRALAQRARIAA